MTNRVLWTEARTELAKAYLKEGLSGQEVAIKLKTTRNAVIGRMNRLGLKISQLNGNKPTKQLHTSRNVVRMFEPSLSKSNPKVRPVIKFRNPGKSRGRKAAVSKLVVIPDTACPITALNLHTCRWPLWGNYAQRHAPGKLYCGAEPVTGKAYCAEHMQVASKPFHVRREPRPFLQMTNFPAKLPKSTVA